MKKDIAREAKRLLSDKTIKAFVGHRAWGEHVGPHVFTSPAELDDLITGDEDKPGGVRYSLFRLLTDLVESYPGETFGIAVRGCDERALQSLFADGRVATLTPRNVIPVGFSCPPELAERCRCRKPWPDALVAGEQTPAAASSVESANEQESPLAELTEWMRINDRCLKCFGCRNACPVCGCKECTVEREVLVPQRRLPPRPSFLLTRAVHMVERCVECGLCEQACPAGIPLRDLYRLVTRLVGQGGVPLGVASVVPTPAPRPPEPEATGDETDQPEAS